DPRQTQSLGPTAWPAAFRPDLSPARGVAAVGKWAGGATPKRLAPPGHLPTAPPPPNGTRSRVGAAPATTPPSTQADRRSETDERNEKDSCSPGLSAPRGGEECSSRNDQRQDERQDL